MTLPWVLNTGVVHIHSYMLGWCDLVTKHNFNDNKPYKQVFMTTIKYYVKTHSSL